MDNSFSKKIYWDLTSAITLVQYWKDTGNEVVFTNGCFDVFHRGHLEVISRAAEMGDKLVIGLNSDSSVERLKGKDRPLTKATNRAEILAALCMVDMVVLFEEDTPEKLISTIIPDVLVKGGDYSKSKVIGRGIVEAHGGRVEIIQLLEGFSTTKLLKKYQNSTRLL